MCVFERGWSGQMRRHDSRRVFRDGTLRRNFSVIFEFIQRFQNESQGFVAIASGKTLLRKYW